MIGIRAHRAPYRRKAPRGIVIVVAMVCVGIAGALLISVLRSAIIGRKGLSIEAHRVQAVWLAESALERAAARLASDPEYDGEVWQVSADQLGGSYSGAVTVEVEPVPDQADHRTVRVRADYPQDPAVRARWSKQLTIQASPSQEEINP